MSWHLREKRVELAESSQQSKHRRCGPMKGALAAAVAHRNILLGTACPLGSAPDITVKTKPASALRSTKTCTPPLPDNTACCMCRISRGLMSDLVMSAAKTLCARAHSVSLQMLSCHA